VRKAILTQMKTTQERIQMETTQERIQNLIKFSYQVIILLTVCRHIDQAMFYSCKQSPEESVTCQSPPLNSSTQMIIDKSKNINLDLNKTGNIRINVTLRCIHITIVAVEKQEVSLCVCVSIFLP
jgi:hypothetical protein